jgi:uncharacterized protein YkwD
MGKKKQGRDHGREEAARDPNEASAMKRTGMCLSAVGVVLAAFVLVHAGETPFKMSEEEAKLLELTNLERKKKELPPLKASPLLFKLARAHSANMAKQQLLDHTLDEKSPFDRMKDAGYQFQKGGENIAEGDESIGIAVIIRNWMESKKHRANILDPEYTEIGLGVGRAKGGKIYYTQVFGKPFPKR